MSDSNGARAAIRAYLADDPPEEKDIEVGMTPELEAWYRQQRRKLRRKKYLEDQRQ